MNGSSSSTSRASSSSSSSTATAEAMKGLLKTTILSVYDLPFTDQPTAVTISCCGITVSSGPPVARHKDKNSFRFSTTPTSTSNLSDSGSTSAAEDDANLLKISAPLRNLYKSKLEIRVLFANKSFPCLYAEYNLNELEINEASWLILTLKPDPTTKAGASLSTSTAVVEKTDDDIQPSIRIKLYLTGPYRIEIEFLRNILKNWFGFIDQIESTAITPVVTTMSNIPLPDKKYILIPAVPVVTAVVVASPLLGGLSIIGLPFLLPVIAVIASVVVSTLLVGGVVYSSTKHGRSTIHGLCGPFADSILMTKPFQTLMYDTGPRPTPVSIARQVLPTTLWSKLVVSLIIDLIGSSSYLLPIVGEAFDLGWAPMQTILIMAMYDATSPNLKYVSFAEEILPFTGTYRTVSIYIHILKRLRIHRLCVSHQIRY